MEYKITAQIVEVLQLSKYALLTFSQLQGIQMKTDPEARLYISAYMCVYTGCPRRKEPNFGRVFLRSNYTDITQNTYIQSSMVTEILNIEK